MTERRSSSTEAADAASANEAPNSVPRSTKGAQTRARLLTAAKTVFETTGFLEARISDIAEAAGLSHGSFYHYFDSKEQIFREIAEAQEALLTTADPEADDDSAAGGQEEGGAKLDGADKGDAGEDGARGGGAAENQAGRKDAAQSDALSDYDRILRANRRYLERYRDNGQIMAVIEEVSRYDDHVNRVRLQRQKHFASRSEASLRRLQEEGRAAADIDPEIAALALGSMVARVAELWLVEHWGDYDLDQIADQVTRLWANAIGLTDTTPSGSKASTPFR